ncbi:hypothetical protein KSS87_008100, partial [Heliosperma pusillum]
MAETACLRRSFSNPPEASLDFSQGDPTRALGESISFGKYMSETLAWEKWSTFTQNRYIEEAEKYSKPGSVAKMKAYFEAHYGRYGANKCVQEQPTDASSRVDVKNEDHDTNLLSTSEPVQESPTTYHPGVDDSSANNVKHAKENHIHSATSERKLAVKNDVEQEKPEKAKIDTMSEQKLADCSAKRLKKSNMSNLSSSLSRLATPGRCKKEGNSTPNRKVSHLSSSLARLATPLRPRKEGQVTPSSRMLVKDSIESKKRTSNTLNMSTSVSSDISKMKKPTPVSLKAGIGKVFTPLGKIIRDSFASSSSTPSRVSVNSVSRHPSAAPQSEARRSRVALEKAFDRSRKLDEQLKCPSTGNVKSSTQSSATFASFSFRTEERAAKRREFFQKRLEKEAENLPFTDNTKVLLIYALSNI